MKELFRKLSSKVSNWVGSPYAFLIAFLLVFGWAVGGLFFGFGDIYQLIINTGTTIITFLMVFLIQNSQNVESKAIQLKLDELIFANKEARNTAIDIEDDDIPTIEKMAGELKEKKKEELKS